MTATCPFCERALEPTTRFGPPLDCCPGCGSCFKHEQRAQVLASYGSDEYLARSEHQHDLRQQRHEARLRVRWVRSHAAPGRLLEAGSAAGVFLDEARAAGFDVRGVEPSPALSGHARDTFSLDVRTGLLQDLEVGEPVDVVCLWHVLEHADDPVGMLRAVAAHLRPGGLVLLEVPNIASPLAAALGERWPALAAREHLTHFSPEGLDRALRRAGLEPCELYTLARWRYRRPRTWIAPRTIASFARDSLHARGVVRRDPVRGDLLRAVARR